MDISSCFQPAQSYVMLSRVQCLEQVYILNKLDPSRMNINQGAFRELKRLESVSFNRNPTPWYSNDAFHIASFNCAGLLSHIPNIRMDQKLLNADLIHIQETSLCTDEQGQACCQIPGYHAHFGSVGNGKGVATYTRKSMGYRITKESNFQISTLSGDIDFINVYRSSGANVTAVMDALEKEINEG